MYVECGKRLCVRCHVHITEIERFRWKFVQTTFIIEPTTRTKIRFQFPKRYRTSLVGFIDDPVGCSQLEVTFIPTRSGTWTTCTNNRQQTRSHDFKSQLSPFGEALNKFQIRELFQEGITRRLLCGWVDVYGCLCVKPFFRVGSYTRSFSWKAAEKEWEARSDGTMYALPCVNSLYDWFDFSIRGSDASVANKKESFWAHLNLCSVRKRDFCNMFALA